MKCLLVQYSLMHVKISHIIVAMAEARSHTTRILDIITMDDGCVCSYERVYMQVVR